MGEQMEKEANFVAEYLRANPNFLDTYPDVLNGLQLSHQQEGAVSLIERQIRLLREQNEQQRQRLDSLMAIAHDNDGLNQRMHQLVLDLLLCPSDEALCQALIEGLGKIFNVEKATCRRFSDLELEESPFIAELIASGHSRCGRFSAVQLLPLFQDQAEQVKSAVLVPLREEGVNGVFALADGDEDRYHPGMATDYLDRLGEIMARLMLRNGSE
jgi:uncharacterized protein YigA (DUF484 family)